MKQNNIIKLVLLIVLYSVFANAKMNWAPIIMGDITTFAPYAKTNTLQTLKDVYKPNDLVSVKVDAALSGDQDWVGVYHKNASSAWANVVSWNWVPHFALSESNQIHEMPVGAYEARLFFHNNVQKKASYPFTVAVNNFQTTKAQYAPNETVSVTVNVPLSGDQDWVGIFPKNADNKFSNVLGWQWVTGHGRFNLIKDKKPMPAGEYEVRLFWHNAYGAGVVAKQTFGFSVNKSDINYGAFGPYTPRKNIIKQGQEVIYSVDGEPNLPTIIFLSASNSYEGLRRYLTSWGYCVIACSAYGNGGNIDHIKRLLTKANNDYQADITKLGIVGKSINGGRAYYIINKLKNENIAGNTKSALISLDGTFPFRMTQNDMHHFDTPTMLIQYGGADGIDNTAPETGQGYDFYQDPYINMTIFNELQGVNTKAFIFIEADNTHGYEGGTQNAISTRVDLLAPMHLFLNHTLKNSPSVYHPKNQTNEVIRQEGSNYHYKCNDVDVPAFNFCDLNNPIYN